MNGQLAADVARLRFARDSDAASVRRWAQPLLASWRLSPLAAEDLLLVLSELVQNVFQHTTSDGEISLTYRQETVLVEVSDSSTEPPQVRQPDPRRVGGRGLIIVAATCLTWGTRPAPAGSGKTVWVRMPSTITG